MIFGVDPVMPIDGRHQIGQVIEQFDSGMIIEVNQFAVAESAGEPHTDPDVFAGRLLKLIKER